MVMQTPPNPVLALRDLNADGDLGLLGAHPSFDAERGAREWAAEVRGDQGGPNVGNRRNTVIRHSDAAYKRLRKSVGPQRGDLLDFKDLTSFVKQSKVVAPCAKAPKR